MWYRGSKPVICRFLDIELEAQIKIHKKAENGSLCHIYEII